MADEEEPQIFPTRFKQPFENPLQALCHSYNVSQPLIELNAGSDIPDTIDMEVIYTAQMPSHALIIVDASSDSPATLPPIIAPIDIFVFNAIFKKDILRLPERTMTPIREDATGVPHRDPSRNIYIVSLPTITVYASHPPSVPLLILFALWDWLPSPPPPDPSRPSSPLLSSLHTSGAPPGSVPSTPPPTPASISSFDSSIATPPPSSVVCASLLATYLLPIPVIEEFPAAGAMAEKMAQSCTMRELEMYVDLNRGLWQNALAFAPRDELIMEIVHVAWNTTREACKIVKRSMEERRARRRVAAAATTPAAEAEAMTPTTPTQASS